MDEGFPTDLILYQLRTYQYLKTHINSPWSKCVISNLYRVAGEIKHKIGCVATFPSLFLTLSLTNKMNNIYYALDMYRPFHMFLSLIFCRYFIYFHSDQVQTYLSYIRVLDKLYDEI